MQKKFKFTNAKLKAIKPHNKDSPSTELELSDDCDVSGLKLLVGKSGSKRFLLRYTFKSKKRSIAIGKFGDIDVATARKIAQKHKTLIAEGIDPKVEKDSYKTMPTLSEFFYKTYLPVIKTRKKTWSKDLERFKQFIEPRLGDVRFQDLTSMDVLQLQQTIANPKKMKRKVAYAPSSNKGLWRFDYITDFSFVGCGQDAELVKEIDFDFTSGLGFQLYSGDDDLKFFSELYKIWESNFISYFESGVFTITISTS